MWLAEMVFRRASLVFLCWADAPSSTLPSFRVHQFVPRNMLPLYRTFSLVLDARHFDTCFTMIGLEFSVEIIIEQENLDVSVLHDNRVADTI